MAPIADREIVPGKTVRRRKRAELRPRIIVRLNKEIIFNKLRAIARVRGVTLAQLAARAGESRSWIDYAMRSATDFKTTTLARIAYIAGIRLQDLLEDAITVEERRTDDDMGHKQAAQTGDGQR